MFKLLLLFFVSKLCEAGKWTVGDCLMAEFHMEFQLHPNVTGYNQTLTLVVPENANVVNSSAECAMADKEKLSIFWQDKALNDSLVLLDRNFTISFSKVANESYYGVARVYGFFTLGEWTLGNQTFHSTIEIDSGDLPKVMFPTPLTMSFVCADLGMIEIPSRLKYPNSPPSGKALANSTIISTDVRFDAFRSKSKDAPGYREPLDCNYQPNDAVPIAVGVALVVLVVCVLVAYLVGRKRFIRRGYQSV